MRSISVLAAAVVLILGFPAANGCGEEDVRQAAESAETQAREAADRVREETRTVRSEAEELVGRAENVIGPDHSVAVTNFVCPFGEPGQPAPPAGSVIALVEVEVISTDDQEFKLGPGDFKLETDDGRQHDAVTNIETGNALTGEITVQPGESVTRAVFFVVPEGLKAPYLVDKAGTVPVKIEVPGQR